MGITGSLPFRWSTQGVSGVEMGSADSKDIGHHSEHPNLVPSVPILIPSRVSSSAASATLIGSSPLKTSCRSKSAYIINVDNAYEGSRHANCIRRSIDSGIKRLGLKRSRGSSTSDVSIPTKRCKRVESTYIPKMNDHSIIPTPLATNSTTVLTETRPQTLEPIPRSATWNTKRCLVTNEVASEAPVEPCYLLNQRLWENKEMLTRLEWMWGMQYDSLELDTEANRIYLRHDLLESFDSNRWLLLPSPEMVNKMWDRRQNFMKDPTSTQQQTSIETIYEGAETFEYRLLPLRHDLDSIHRFDQPDLTGMQSHPGTEKPPIQHSYPFDTLPTLVSRAKPHFVICDSAAKLYHEITSGHSGLSQVVRLLWPVSERDATVMLAYVERIYGTWLRFEPPSTFASSPRTPLRLPSPDTCPRLPIRRHLRPQTCVRPCFRSRFAWTPLLCSRCRNGGIDGGSTDSDNDGDLVSLSPSEAASEYRAYHRHLSHTVKLWRSCCLKEVRKRGRWTSCVLNDDQLGSYAEERPRKIGRTV